MFAIKALGHTNSLSQADAETILGQNTAQTVNILPRLYPRSARTPEDFHSVEGASVVGNQKVYMRLWDINCSAPTKENNMEGKEQNSCTQAHALSW